MSDIIRDNYHVLLVMSRFGIALGVGEKSIGEVCRDNGVDTDTFLAIINLLQTDGGGSIDASALSVEALLSYLQRSHNYFLEYRLPAIRGKLTGALDTQQNALNRAVIHYFDEYVDEVRKHMAYEEETVFPYVRTLLGGKKGGKYRISMFGKQHEQVEVRLTEFKNILIKYYPAQSTNELNSVLFDIFSCEKDLKSHNDVEDILFIPAVTLLEQKSAKS